MGELYGRIRCQGRVRESGCGLVRFRQGSCRLPQDLSQVRRNLSASEPPSTLDYFIPVLLRLLHSCPWGFENRSHQISCFSWVSSDLSQTLSI